MKTLLVKCPAAQWQPDGLTIHTKKWLLGAGFLGAPPISLSDPGAGAQAGRAGGRPRPQRRYGQSPYEDSGLQRVSLRQNLDFEWWNSHVHREFLGKFESTHLSRDNLSRQIGRTCEVLPSATRQRELRCDSCAQGVGVLWVVSQRDEIRRCTAGFFERDVVL